MAETQGATETEAPDSIRPWLVHRRMLPKWAAFVATGAAAIWLLDGMTPWLVVVGFFLFFPMEYGVHRGVFHFFADTSAGKVLSKQHVLHHQDPEDVDVLFNHPGISVSVGIGLFALYWGIFGSLSGAAAISFGNFGGLLYYELTHLNTHRPGRRPWTPWGRWIEKIHLLHHYKNERWWFGVTNPLFDLALGTYADEEETPKSDSVRTLVPPDEVEEIIGDED